MNNFNESHVDGWIFFKNLLGNKRRARSYRSNSAMLKFIWIFTFEDMMIVNMGDSVLKNSELGSIDDVVIDQNNFQILQVGQMNDIFDKEAVFQRQIQMLKSGNDLGFQLQISSWKIEHWKRRDFLGT